MGHLWRKPKSKSRHPPLYKPAVIKDASKSSSTESIKANYSLLQNDGHLGSLIHATDLYSRELSQSEHFQTPNQWGHNGFRLPPPSFQIHQSNLAVDQYQYTNRSPLHCAVSVANVACVCILIQHGAEVNAPDHDGLTPLHTCIIAGQSEGYHAVARLLIQSGASLEARDKLGCTPLQMAAERGSSTMVEVLAELGADVNAF